MLSLWLSSPFQESRDQADRVEEERQERASVEQQEREGHQGQEGYAEEELHRVYQEGVNAACVTIMLEAEMTIGRAFGFGSEVGSGGSESGNYSVRWMNAE
jgi:hypothetical protein